MEYFYLGIDPSTVSTGFAVIDREGKLIEYGVIKPGKTLLPHQKLHYQYEHITALMKKYPIIGMNCEEQFGGPSQATFKKLCQVTGVMMLLAAQHGVKFELKYPASWRKDFHGNGAVKKEDTLILVNELFDLELKKKDNDKADAIGLGFVAYKTGEKKP